MFGLCGCLNCEEKFVLSVNEDVESLTVPPISGRSNKSRSWLEVLISEIMDYGIILVVRFWTRWMIRIIQIYRFVQITFKHCWCIISIFTEWIIKDTITCLRNVKKDQEMILRNVWNLRIEIFYTKFRSFRDWLWCKIDSFFG